MTDLQVFREMAEQILSVPTLKGTSDRYLTDRAFRILRHCAGIVQLTEVQRFQIDQESLQVAALFRDAGFARFVRQQEKTVRLVLADVTDEDLRDFSAQVVQEKLAGLLEPAEMERICHIIINSGRRDTTLIEAMILADARNLDDMGAVGIFNEMRRYVIHGRGATEALTGWNRKIEYDYWAARLRESFRFESVRKIAEQRLRAAQTFMEQLERENRAADLEQLILQQKKTVLTRPASPVDLPAASSRTLLKTVTTSK